MIARYLPRSLNLLTNESRADKREKLHDATGEQAGGSSSPFLVNSLSCIHEHEHLFAELAVLTPGDARDIARSIDVFFRIPAERRHAAARRIADRYDWNLVIRPVADWLQRTFPEKTQCAASSSSVGL